MAEFNKPVLICKSSHKNFRNDGELICGVCGYEYHMSEAEELLRYCELWPDSTGAFEVHSRPICCIQCACKYDFVYFSDMAELCCIVPTSLFKNRYITKYGELVLTKEGDLAEFIPSLDPSRRIKMAYTDSIAYMLYSSGIKADKLKMLIDRYECILYNGGTIIDASLYEDINRVSGNAFCHYANQFDKIVTAMDEMKKGDFVLGNFVFMEGD